MFAGFQSAIRSTLKSRHAFHVDEANPSHHLDGSSVPEPRVPRPVTNQDCNGEFRERNFCESRLCEPKASIRILRDAYAAFNRGDIAAAVAHLILRSNGPNLPSSRAAIPITAEARWQVI